jgi:hypothetical protein
MTKHRLRDLCIVSFEYVVQQILYDVLVELKRQRCCYHFDLGFLCRSCGACKTSKMFFFVIVFMITEIWYRMDKNLSTSLSEFFCLFI